MFKLFKTAQVNVNGLDDANSSPSDPFDQVNGQSPFDSPSQTDTSVSGLSSTTSAASGSSGLSFTASAASGSSGGSTVTVSTPGSGLVFVNTYDSSITVNPAGYEACIVAAEKQLESLFTNSVTLNVTFKEANSPGSGFALTNSWPSTVDVSYATLGSKLQSLTGEFLPATDPNPAGGNDWALPEAYARMLGLSSSTPATDDTVTLNTAGPWSFGQDVINGVTHELTEGAMGRIGGLGTGAWGTMDLFRYNASGVLDTTNGKDGDKTYFSNDGGATLSNQNNPAKGAPTLSFNNQLNTSGTKVNKGDTDDWTQNQVFGSTGNGETLTLVQAELDVMQALGWNVSLTQDVLTGGIVAWETPNADFSDWSTGSMPITPQDAYIDTAITTLNSNVTVHSVGTSASTLFEIGNNTACKLIAIDGTALNLTDTSSVGSGNNGQLAVEPGSSLQIGNTFTNAGKLGIGVGKGAGGGSSATSATLYLNDTLGPVTLNGGGTVGLGQLADPSNSEILTYGDILNAPGTSGDGLDNVDNTITGAGVIRLGTFDNQASGKVDASQAGGYWLQISASTFTNEGLMTAETGATLRLGDDGATEALTNTGAIDIDGGARLAISGNLTIAGSGAINFKGAGTVITSDGFGPATFTNTSTINAINSGQIGDIGITSNDLTFDNDGNVYASGSGVTLTINTGAHTVLNETNGVLQAEGGATLAILSNVTNQDLIAAGTSPLSSVGATTGTVDLGQDGGTGSMTNTGTVAVFGNSDLAISGNYTITTPSSTGAIDLKGAGADITSDGNGPATFTNASTINAIASGQIGDKGIKASNDLTFDNDGKVYSSGSGVTLTINTGAHTVLNETNGVLQAEGGSTLAILSNVTNQNVIAAGTPASSSVGATTGTVDLGQDGGTGTMTNTGAVAIYGGSDLAISGNYTISGSGKLYFKGAGADITSDGNAAATFTNENTIDVLKSGQIGDQGIKASNDLTFVNAGTVVASGSGVKLTLNTGSNTIDDSGGLLEAMKGATLVIDSNIGGSGGTIEAAVGGTVTLAATVASVSAPIDFAAGGTLNILDSSLALTVNGSKGTIAVKGLSDALTDDGTSDKFKIGQNVGSLSISNFGSDTTGIIDLLNHVGGFATAAAAFAALTSDGSGGSLLSLGADGSIDLKGVAPSALHVTNFKIG